MRDASGKFTSFSAPFPNVATSAVSVNGHGRITGTYFLHNKQIDHDFVATF
jgi:hypothetical protein